MLFETRPHLSWLDACIPSPIEVVSDGMRGSWTIRVREPTTTILFKLPSVTFHS